MNNYPTKLLTPEATGTPDASKRFYVVGIAMFVIAVGLLVVRLLAYYLPADMDETLADVVFSLLVQVGILLVTTFLIYKFAFKMTTRGVLAFSNFRKTKWYNCALAVPLGILGLFVTIGVSTFWLIVLMMFGYTPAADSTTYPAEANLWLFLLQIVLTAVLPAICEEFAIRGGFFTTMKKSYKGMMLYVIMAIAFGLFHQNIRQVFYTALFGGVMAFLIIKTKSIWPCIIVHFVNNGLSVYLDYAEQYGWAGGNVMDYIFTALTENFAAVFFTFVLIVGAYVGLMLLYNYLNSVKVLKAKKETILDSGFNHTQGRVVLLGEENPEKVRELQLEQEVYGGKLPDNLYKPGIKERAFYIGAIVTTAVFTFFSFLFGFFY